MKFQLFVPPQGYVAQRWSEGSSMPSLGILYLAAVLEKEGIEVEIVPADILGYNWKDVSKRIKDFKPDVVGVTTCTENRFDSFKLAKTVKGVNPNITTVLGGPHISMVKEETLINIKEVDILVVGEGEKTVVELAHALNEKGDLSKVKGICLRSENGEAVFTGDRDKIQKLDSLPYPARHLVPMDKYNFYITTRDGRKRKAQNIMTSRGCPFNCYFCSTPVNWGRKVRSHSPERVLEEIEHVIDTYGAQYIWFYDDTLNFNPVRLHKIMDMIIERKLDIKFTSEFRIDLIDKPLLEKMRKAGLEIGSFGIEAGNARVRRNIVRKNFDIKLAYQFLEWSREFDFIPGPFFIFSHYTETWEEAQETIEIMEKVKSINPQADISTAILHVYPGTYLENIAKKTGIIPEDFSWSKKLDMKRVYSLPAAQGNVPLFKDKLNWWQIANLVMRWSSASKKRVSTSKIKQAVRSIKGVNDIFIDIIFFITLIRFKLGNIFRNK